MNKNIKTQEREAKDTNRQSTEEETQTSLKHLGRCSYSLHRSRFQSIYMVKFDKDKAHKMTGNGNCHSPAVRGQHRETLREPDKITPVTDVFILQSCTSPLGTASQRCPCTRTRHQTHRAFTSCGIVHCVWQGWVEDAHPGACPTVDQNEGGLHTQSTLCRAKKTGVGQ